MEFADGKGIRLRGRVDHGGRGGRVGVSRDTWRLTTGPSLNMDTWHVAADCLESAPTRQDNFKLLAYHGSSLKTGSEPPHRDSLTCPSLSQEPPLDSIVLVCLIVLGCLKNFDNLYEKGNLAFLVVRTSLLLLDPSPTSITTSPFVGLALGSQIKFGSVGGRSGGGGGGRVDVG